LPLNDPLCLDKDPKDVLEQLDSMFGNAGLCCLQPDKDDETLPNRSNWALEDLISIIDCTVRHCRKRKIKSAAYGWSQGGFRRVHRHGHVLLGGDHTDLGRLALPRNNGTSAVFQKKSGSIPPEPDELLASAMYAEELISSLDKNFMEKTPKITSSHRAGRWCRSLKKNYCM
jgi:hypothetical protein